jgi:response regulator RpfG family c-di-GMP phosphodiesterase
VVDDNNFNLTAAKGVFRLLEVKLDTCYNGREAVDKVIEMKTRHNHSYSVILMDLEMPVLDGHEVGTCGNDIDLIRLQRNCQILLREELSIALPSLL